LFLSLTAYAQPTPSATAKQYIEGKDYVLIASPVPTITGDKIEITEVLRYSNVKSFNFESVLEPWKKRLADDVEFVRNPVIWNRDTATRARVYFTADVLGVGDAVNKKLFETLHVDVNVNYRALLEDNDIADMFESLGVSRDKFNKKFKDFVVNHKFSQTEVRVRSFAIESTRNNC